MAEVGSFYSDFTDILYGTKIGTKIPDIILS